MGVGRDEGRTGCPVMNVRALDEPGDARIEFGQHQRPAQRTRADPAEEQIKQF